MKILETQPVGFWPLDAGDFRDYSGNPTYNAVLTGTARTGVGLNAFVKYSQNLNSTRTVTFTAPVYQNNEKRQSFSIGATVYPISNNAFQIFSNSSNNDGLYWNGKSIEFTTKYASAGEARCSYTPPLVEKFDVVGVHTPSRNSLYVNGSLVAEVDVSAAQSVAAYVNNSTNFVATTTNGEFLINSVFATRRALDATKVRELYEFSNDRHEDEVPVAYDGQTFSLSTDQRFAYINLNFSKSDDWDLGQLTNAEIYNDSVNATRAAGLTIASSWLYSVPLSTGAGTLIDTVGLDWQGNNITVETSYEGGAWTTATKRQKLTNVPSGTTMTSQQLAVRVSFTAGQSEAYLSRLTARVFASGSIVKPDTRTVVLNNVVSLEPSQPMRLRDDWGANVQTSVVFQADPATTPTNPKTVEIWMKRSADFTHSLSNVTGTFINGASASNVNTQTSVGEWFLVHYTTSTAQTTVTLNGPVQIGSVSFYENVLTASEINSIYMDYTGRNVSSVGATDAIALTEKSALPVTYAFDWTILNS